MISREYFIEVVSENGTADVEKTKANALAVKRQREMYRKPYASSVEGRELLLATIVDSGIFHADDSDTSSRAFVLRLLESMGVLDEGNLKKYVNFILSDSIDVIPSGIIEEIARNEKANTQE